MKQKQWQQEHSQRKRLFQRDYFIELYAKYLKLGEINFFVHIVTTYLNKLASRSLSPSFSRHDPHQAAAATK